MWIFLWLILSAFVLGIFSWSTAILQQQKKAWSAFAKKMNLAYTPGKFTEPPSVTGAVQSYKLSFFTDSQATADARGRRYITAIEIEMGSGMPATAAIGSPDYAAFLAPLRMDQTLAPAAEGWNPQIIIKTSDSAGLARYLTPERLKVLSGLFAMKGASTLLFFDERDSVLRVQTSDPLRDAARMEKIARRLIAAADTLAPIGQERREPPPEVVAAPVAPTPAAESPPAAASDADKPA